MRTSDSDRGASRLFHTIVVVGAMGAAACGGTVTETSPDGDPTATGGTPQNTGGGTATGGVTTTGGASQNTGGVVSVGGTISIGGSGGNTDFTPDNCLEWDDFVCTDELATGTCGCDPLQPDTSADCPPDTYLVWNFPLPRKCFPAVTGAEVCDNPAQYTEVWVEELSASFFVCDIDAPLTEADCFVGSQSIGEFSCLSYDPPTSCQCYVGILK